MQNRMSLSGTYSSFKNSRGAQRVLPRQIPSAAFPSPGRREGDGRGDRGEGRAGAYFATASVFSPNRNRRTNSNSTARW